MITPWIFASAIMVVYVVALSYLLRPKTQTAVKVAALGTLGAMCSILGSVALANANARQARAAEVRKLKQDYYHSYCRAVTDYMAAQEKTRRYGGSIPTDLSEKVRVETARLPLYASEEVTLCAASTLGNTTGVPPEVLYTHIRRDLVSDEYRPFKNLTKVPIAFVAADTNVERSATPSPLN